MLSGTETAKMRALKNVINVCETLIPRYRPWADYDYKHGQEKLMLLLRAASLDFIMPETSRSGLTSLTTLVRQLHSHSLGSPISLTDPVKGLVYIQTSIKRLECKDPRDAI